MTDVPQTFRALDTLERVDYTDFYTATVEGARERTPEQWARVVIEDTTLGRRARILWRLIGLRLAPPGAPGYVQGWRIADGGDDWIRLETSAWFATAHAVCRVDDEQVSVGLFLRYEHPAAPLLWLAVGVAHRRALPAMLAQAVRR